MSVDKTISDLSVTLEQLSQLVGHINNQIVGITSRINITLDTFDRAISNIAGDANAMTSQVSSTVSQVPNSWIFYLLFITLIIVFVLVSVILIINLATKFHAIYRYCTSRSDPEEKDLLNTSPMSVTTVDDTKPFVPDSRRQRYNPALQQQQRQVAIPMDSEPRRPGLSLPSYSSRSRDGTLVEEDYTRTAYQRRTVPTSGASISTAVDPEVNGGRYNLQTGVTSPYSTGRAEAYPQIFQAQFFADSFLHLT